MNGEVVIGDQLILPPITIEIDGKASPDPSLSLSFTLLPGGVDALTVPAKPSGSLSGLLVYIGERERKGNRLRLREAAIRSDGAARPWMTACAAKEGVTRWDVVWRRSTVPSGEDCAAPTPSDAAPALLAASALTIDEKTIKADLKGSAYVIDARQPPQARWLQWAKGNLFLSAVLTGVLVTLATWLVKTVRGGKPSA